MFPSYPGLGSMWLNQATDPSAVPTPSWLFASSVGQYDRFSLLVGPAGGGRSRSSSGLIGVRWFCLVRISVFFENAPDLFDGIVFAVIRG